MMRKKNMGWLAITLGIFLGLTCPQAPGELPPDFPSLTVLTCDTNAVSDGYIFLEVTDAATNGGYYLMILNNDGTPVWYRQVPDHNYDFKVLPNGFLHYAEFFHTHSWTGGGDCTHEILDHNYVPRESIVAGNGYVADSHDFQLLPNGHVLLLGYYKTLMDVSKYVAGGYPNALIAGAIIQELDAERNVIFQWRTWDHFTIPTYFPPTAYTNSAARNPVIDAFHLNTVVLDTDGHLLISNFGMDVWKINRQTGEILWRLGGLANQFSFVGVDPLQARTHFSGHTVSRLDNGNILIYCNADQLATRPSKVYEYQLDETNKIATLVWSYTPPTNYYAWHYGSAQRLANGNTFIGWGGANIMPGLGGVTNQWIPTCTEVTPEGQVVFELRFTDPKMASYRAYRFAHPPQAQATVSWFSQLTAGNTYTFDDTGVSLTVLSGGGGYNDLTVTREPYAPVDPLFSGKAPCVLPLRVSLSEYSIPELEARFEFDSAGDTLVNPTNVTVYYRAQTGQGPFLPQLTDYNPVTKKWRVTIALTSQLGDLGEFIFGYPDLADVPYPPLLAEVENYRGVQTQEVIGPKPAVAGNVCTVNQELPILLSWSPRGLARGFKLQIASNPDFADPVVEVANQAEGFLVWSNATPFTTYFYRVKTLNDGGESDWAPGSFRTVAPLIQVTAPNGGEAWQRGAKYFIQWEDNLAEKVVIDLYQGGAFLKSLVTNASTGAWRWQVDADLVPAGDYSIKISSTTGTTLFDLSDRTFSLDLPVINAGSLIRLEAGQLQFGLTAPGAAQATVLVSTNLADPSGWEAFRTLMLSNSSAVFTDDTAPHSSARFYRLRVP